MAKRKSGEAPEDQKPAKGSKDPKDSEVPEYIYRAPKGSYAFWAEKEDRILREVRTTTYPLSYIRISQEFIPRHSKTAIAWRSHNPTK
jgi:hypothetical protein